ncbi:MAG: sodium:proton antiporter [Pirellulales bacterium]
MTDHVQRPPANWPVLAGIALVIVVYLVLLGLGWFAPAAHADEHAAHGAVATPQLFTVAPFVGLLGAIAILPLIPAASHWWEDNLHRLYVAGGLALLTLGLYAAVVPGHGTGRAWDVLTHTILSEYIPFMVLLFSLYTISGGVRIQGDLPAHPTTNAVFLGVGAVLASLVGTTGAAMLLIRPLIETNSERKHVQHTVVFFIFVVCNCGGCLLPIGDPPLFLGYLRGVEFLWTLHNLWLPWLVTNGLLIGLYWLLDKTFFYPHETRRDIALDEARVRPLQISGLGLNLPLLVGVILAVALLDPNKPFPGTHWTPPAYLREVVQLGLVGLSLALGQSRIREANRFNYAAILEVAALFIGIFITMQPAIEILHDRGPQLGINTPDKFFWATGSLSSVLDNAPTYLVFFQTAAAGHPGEEFTTLVNSPGRAQQELIAISLGAVFLGAMTYIGNGPNFMVRAIAEQMNVRMPSFFGYVFRYSVPVLLPVFMIVAWLFVRNVP